MQTLSFFWPFIKLGLTDIWRHKARSVLTMLGMVFGVGSVVAMLAVGEGTSEQALEAIRRLGSDNIIIESVKPADDESMIGERSRVVSYGLLYDDEIRIRESVSGVKRTVPVRIAQRDARMHERTLQLRVIETTPDWFEIVKRPMLAGRVLSEKDMAGVVNVCVLTEHGMRRLLPGQNVLGERIRISGSIFEVVGVVKNETDASSAQSPDSQTDVYIPITAGRRLFGEANLRMVGRNNVEGERIELSRIVVQMKDVKAVEPADRAITTLLKRFHKKEDYRMNVPLMLLRETERSKKMYNVVLGAIAGISLLVGGIGIMNIMLASVTERTKEIGIRRAIGARKNRIVIQFLINTCVISITGGLVGLLVGVAIPFAITWFTGVATCIRAYSLILAFGISALTGIVFGLYPALRAASLDPIEALRHE